MMPRRLASSSRGLRGRLRFAGLVAACSLVVGCTDNATRLSHAIERATGSVGSGPGAPAQTIAYTPKSGSSRPHFLIFFPDHEMRRADLEAAGVPGPLAARVFSEMAYLPIGLAPFLVVVQEGGGLNFTTHWSRFASVPELLVVSTEGPVELLLRPTAGGTVVERAERP